MPRPNTGFTGHFETMPGSEDLFLKLPEEFLQAEDWHANDVLTCEVKPESITVINKTKAIREKKLG